LLGARCDASGCKPSFKVPFDSPVPLTYRTGSVAQTAVHFTSGPAARVGKRGAHVPQAPLPCGPVAQVAGTKPIGSLADAVSMLEASKDNTSIDHPRSVLPDAERQDTKPGPRASGSMEDRGQHGSVSERTAEQNASGDLGRRHGRGSDLLSICVIHLIVAKCSYLFVVYTSRHQRHTTCKSRLLYITIASCMQLHDILTVLIWSWKYGAL